jgi:uncharacterized membrane protein YkoI
MNLVTLNRFVGEVARDVRICALLLFAGASVAWGIEGVQPDSLVGKCQAAVQRTFTGQVKRIWAKTEDHTLSYEFEGIEPGGTRWRVECNAITLKVTETEREVAATDKEFAAQAKVDEATARSLAVSAFPPGEVVATRYIIESDGTAVYEFDITATRGGLIRIEVGAATGALFEVSPILWSTQSE